MPKASPIYTNFTAGEVSPFMDGRTDFDKYFNSAKTCLNYIPTVHGPATKRPGTVYAGTTKTSSEKSRLMPFRPNVVQPYVLECGATYMRFYRNEGQVTVGDTDASITNGTFASDISGWTNLSSNSGAAAWNSAGYAQLTGNGSTNDGHIEQSVSVGASFTSTTHVLKFRVINHDYRFLPVDVRIGTTTGGTDIINDQDFYPGYHTLSFTPGTTTVFIGFRNIENPLGTSSASVVGIDDVSLIDNAALEVQSPYAVADVFELNHAQSADVLYICHQDYRPHKLKRLGDLDWSLEEVNLVNGPYQDENTNENILVTTSATDKGATVTLTASGGSPFESDMVGTYVRLFESGDASKGYGTWESGKVFNALVQVEWDGNVYEAQNTDTTGANAPVHTEGERWDGERNNSVRWQYLHDRRGDVLITSYSSGTSVGGIITRRISDEVMDNDTWRYSFSSYSPKYGWPAAVTFYEDRLYFGGGTTTPQRFDGSATGDFENMLDGEDDDRSVSFTLNADEVNVIRWMNAGRTLQIGTVGGEWEAQGGTANGPITPSSISVKRGTTYGSAQVQAKRIGNAVLFVTRGSRSIRELAYDFNQDTLVAPDMTILAEHIARATNGITQVDYQQESDSILWAVRGDGVLLGLTYERAQDVVGWSRHILGGAFSGGDPVVESVAVIPSPNLDHDQVWVQVKRTVNGGTVRYVEFISDPFTDEVDNTDWIGLDSALTYDSTPTTSISGLDHLEGETVYAWADGAEQGPFTVTSGAITITSASTVQVGLRYTARLQTMRVDSGAADGTAQGKTKRIHDVVFRMWRSAGGTAGPDTTTQDTVPGLTSVTTGDAEMRWPGGYETDGHIVFEVTSPEPSTVIAIMPQLVTQDD